MQTSDQGTRRQHLETELRQRLWPTSTERWRKNTTGNEHYIFIPVEKLPKDRQVSYMKLVASIRPNKTEVNRVRLTAGSDRLEYLGVMSTDVASLTTPK